LSNGKYQVIKIPIDANLPRKTKLESIILGYLERMCTLQSFMMEFGFGHWGIRQSGQMGVEKQY
jgi:hypothetical protein